MLIDLNPLRLRLRRAAEPRRWLRQRRNTGSKWRLRFAPEHDIFTTSDVKTDCEYGWYQHTEINRRFYARATWTLPNVPSS